MRDGQARKEIAKLRSTVEELVRGLRELKVSLGFEKSLTLNGLHGIVDDGDAGYYRYSYAFVTKPPSTPVIPEKAPRCGSGLNVNRVDAIDKRLAKLMDYLDVYEKPGAPAAEATVEKRPKAKAAK